MADRSVKVTLRANVSDFKAQMGQASKSLEDVAAKSDKTGKVAETHLGRLAQHAQLQQQQWSTVSTGLMTFGAVGVAAVGAAVKKFADFDAAMSEVQADTQESAANMELLRTAAIAAGADTQYSATEAAEAIDSLAKAGISTADILSGGLAGALDLAASGGLAVGDAAEIAATALTQFNLKGSDVGHVADLLAAGAGKAQGDVSDLGMALKQSGLVASQTGLSIDETTGALTAFASAGLLGSDAGTSFKSMLQRLTPQSQEAQSLMDELGISAYDAQGNFVGLANFAGNLQSSLAGLTTEQRNSAMATIFGADAVRAASVFYEQGQAGIQGWIDKVNDSGYAARIAAQKTDNLKGDIERLGGSMETAMIKAGSGINDVLRGLVQWADKAVDAFGRLPAPAQQGALGLLAIAAGGAGVIGIGMKMFTTVSEVNTALTDLGLRGGKVEGALKGVSKALGVAAAATAAYAVFLNDLDNEWQANAEDATAFTNQIATVGKIDISKAFAGINDGYWGRQAVDVENFGDALQTAIDPGFWGRIDNAMTSFVGSVDTASLKAQQQFKGIGQSLADMSSTDLPSAQKAFKSLWESAGGDDATGAKLLSVMPAYKASLTELATQLGIVVDDATLLKLANGELGGSMDDTGDATSTATAAIQDQTQALHDLLDAQKEAAGIAMSVDEAQGAWAQQIDDNAEAVKKLTGYVDENGNAVEGLGVAVTANKDAWDLNSEAGRLANDTMLDTSSKAWSLIDALKAQNASEGDLRASMQSSRDEFILTATQMGMNETAAKALADRYGLIPERVTTTVNAVTDDARRKIDAVIAQIASLPLHKTVTVEALTYATTYAQTIYSASGPSGSGNALHRALGGPIYGPGTGTSDDILMWGSNGEHMWATADVLAAGGQSAVYALRAAVRRDGADAVRRAVGVPGYAAVGAVPREARVPSSFYSQPRVSVAAPQVSMPQVLQVVDADGVLVGRMRVEAAQQARVWVNS